MPIPLLTINTYDFKKEKTLGTIIVSSASTRQYISDKDVPKGHIFAMDVSSVFGGKSIVFTRSVEDAIDDAKIKLYSEIRKKYSSATCVIGLQVSLTSQMMDTGSTSAPLPIITITLTGTVVGRK